ncbi:phosphonate ABC transporter, permease protein PhnE [Prosthecomicrobium sp. N25]
MPVANALPAGPFADLDRAALAARHPDIFRPTLRMRLVVVGILLALVALFVFGLWRLEFSATRILSGLGQLGTFAVLMLPPDPGSWSRFWLFLHGLAETLAIAFLGTLLAATLALPFGFLAARNVVPNWIFHFGLRRFLDTLRGVDTLIWALVWINVVGLGPFAGVLAIMSSDFGAFGKLFSEAIETADRKPVEGVVSAGGSRLHEVRFGLLPQVLPVILSQVLYYFESNTRSATIIGIVGAGGIGLHLSEAIRTLEWQQVSALVLMILVTVSALDWLSTRLRFAVIGRRAAP